jgi:F0F1-type ATP synthase delta subunit
MNSRTQLAQVIAQRTMEVQDLSLLAQEVAAFLLENNQVNELESLMRDVLAYRQAHGILEANVATAHDLNIDVQKEVAALLKEHYPQAKQVIVRQTHDDSIVGGLKVDLANEQLDMSVRAKLDTFKRLTTEGNI